MNEYALVIVRCLSLSIVTPIVEHSKLCYRLKNGKIYSQEVDIWIGYFLSKKVAITCKKLSVKKGDGKICDV